MSDPHFDQQKIFEYRKNKFDCVGDMNLAIVDNVLNTMRKGDILYLLGDIYNMNYLSRFRGFEIVIILGNHERDMYNGEKIEQLERVIKNNRLTATIYHDPIQICDGFIWLSHEPVDKALLKCSINIHGHYHPGELYSGVYKTGTFRSNHYFNCAVDYIGYKPISLVSIYREMNIL